MNVAVIVFGGVGSRISSALPKQFIKIKDKELVVYTIEKFNNSKCIDEIVLVTNKDYLNLTKELVNTYKVNKVKHIFAGGTTRQESVKIALEKTNYKDDDIVLIHDGDRPLISGDIIFVNIKELENHEIVCTAIKHKFANSKVSNSGRKIVVDGEQIDIQTPQSFKYGLIKTAHLNSNREVSDDISLLEDKYDVYFVDGDKDNFKVTTNEDLEYLKTVL